MCIAQTIRDSLRASRILFATTFAAGAIDIIAIVSGCLIGFTWLRAEPIAPP